MERGNEDRVINVEVVSIFGFLNLDLNLNQYIRCIKIILNENIPTKNYQPNIAFASKQFKTI